MSDYYTAIKVDPGLNGALEVTLAGGGTGICLHAHDEAMAEQIAVLVEALRIYAERNVHYKDNWKRMGYRGALIRVRERSERLWDSLWSAPSDVAGEDPAILDDALDLINFAGFLIRGARDANRDGTWW